MDFDPAELDALTREDLILRARARGVERPEQMTRVELRDEIVRLSEPDLERQRRSRGWLGVARDLLASVVESGLNLPDAAAAIRGDARADVELGGPPPVATVTLAEIYAAQGHYDKALRMLDEVLAGEPGHEQALACRQRLLEERELGPGRKRKPSTPAVPEPAPAELVPPEPVAAEPAARLVAEAVAEAAVEAVAEAAAVAEERAELVAEAVAEAAVEAVAPAAEPAPEPVAPPPPEPAPVPEHVVAAESPAPSEGQPALLVLRAEDRAFVFWRLPALSDSLRLRAVTVRPAVHGATVEEEDHRVTLQVGGFWLPRLAPGAEVRAALGELSHEGFAPLTVARVLGSDHEPTFDPLGAEVDDQLEAAARDAAGL